MTLFFFKQSLLFLSLSVLMANCKQMVKRASLHVHTPVSLLPPLQCVYVSKLVDTDLTVWMDFARFCTSQNVLIFAPKNARHPRSNICAMACLRINLDVSDLPSPSAGRWSATSLGAFVGLPCTQAKHKPLAPKHLWHPLFFLLPFIFFLRLSPESCSLCLSSFLGRGSAAEKATVTPL